MKKYLFITVLIFSIVLLAWKENATKTVTWYLNNTKLIGGFRPEIWGNPIVKVEGRKSAIYFDGVDDGLVIPAVPIEGWSKFTIEVLFKPDGDGPVAPRLIHFEDTLLNRGTFELRLKNNQWYFDGFLRNGKTRKGIALVDSAKLHPANEWQWAALVYDGHKMYSYINGQKELEAAMELPPMTKGNISMGVRLNKKNWFKGQIRKIIFYPVVIDPKSLNVSE